MIHVQGGSSVLMTSNFDPSLIQPGVASHRLRPSTSRGTLLNGRYNERESLIQTNDVNMFTRPRSKP